jgi:hypothetical protein
MSSRCKRTVKPQTRKSRVSHLASRSWQCDSLCTHRLRTNRKAKRVAGTGHWFLRLCDRRGAARLLGSQFEKTRSAQARSVPAGVAAAPAGVRRRGSVRRLPRHGVGAEHGLCVRMGLYCPRGVDCDECALLYKWRWKFLNAGKKSRAANPPFVSAAVMCRTTDARRADSRPTPCNVRPAGQEPAPASVSRVCKT